MLAANQLQQVLFAFHFSFSYITADFSAVFLLFF